MRRGLGFHARRSPGVFNPASLFLGGTVNGAWYDPSDSTTLFSDRAGTTPCGTPGGGSVVPVGLMLDKSQGLQRFWSGYFDGTGDYLTAPSNAAFQYGTGNFTVEGWHYLTAVAGSTKYLFDQRISGTGVIPALYISGGSYLYYVNTSIPLTAGAVVANTWVHWAIVRNSGTTTLYINGSAVGSFADSNNYSPAAQFRIGSEWSASGLYDWQGYLSNVRAVKGVAVYTANFTPPSPVTGLTAISGTSLLTCQNSTFIDNSSNAFAITVNGNTVTSQNIPLGNHAIAANDTTARPELRARVNLLLNTDTLSTQNVTTQATTYTLRFTGAGSITLSGTGSGTYSAGSNSVTCTAGTLTLTVSGTVTNADLRPANIGTTIPAYQRIADQYTYDNVGFPRYLSFDGVDDYFNVPGSASAMKFLHSAVSSTCAGVYFANSSNPNTSYGFYGTNSGTFSEVGIFTAYDDRSGLGFNDLFRIAIANASGSAVVNNAQNNTLAPITPSVVFFNSDPTNATAANRSALYVNNGTAVAANTASGTASTANSTHQLSIGAIGNGNGPALMNCYGLIIVNATITGGQRTATQNWIAAKMGVTLP